MSANPYKSVVCAEPFFFDKHDHFSRSYASVRHLWESVSFLAAIKDLSTIGVDKKAGKHTWKLIDEKMVPFFVRAIELVNF